MQLTYQDILELVCSIFRSYITFLFSQSLCSQDYTGTPLDLHGKTHSWLQILPRFSAQLDSQWLDLNEKNTMHNTRQEKLLNFYSAASLVTKAYAWKVFFLSLEASFYFISCRGYNSPIVNA